MKIDTAIEMLQAKNIQVPHPMRLPTEQEVRQMEQQIGVPFHSDYRQYLLKASHVVYGTLEPATITDPASHTYLPEVIASARAYDLPATLLPICEDNGDFYCLTKSGEVVFWSHQGTTNERWQDLAAWIQEVWLHESG